MNRYVVKQNDTVIGDYNDETNAVRRAFEILEKGLQLRGTQISVEDTVARVVFLVGDRTQITFNRCGIVTGKFAAIGGKSVNFIL